MKRFFVFFLFLSVCVSCMTSAFALGYQPSDSFLYLSVSTQELGDCLIVFAPSVGARALTLDEDGVPINATTGTVTGFIYTDTSLQTYRYAVRWGAFGTVASSTTNYTSMYAGYRSADTSYNNYWQKLTITAVHATNFDFSEGVSFPANYWYAVIVVLLMFISFMVLRRVRR